MEDTTYVPGLDMFCGGLMFIILVLVLVIVNRSLHPNSHLLFGFGNLNRDRPVYVGSTGGMGVQLGVSLPFLVLLMMTAIILFKSLPLAMSLLLLVTLLPSILVLRYFQLALRLDRDGKTEAAKIGSISAPVVPTALVGIQNVPRRNINFTYANGNGGELLVDEATTMAIRQKTIRLNVTYLEPQPGILRVVQEAIPGETSASSAEAPRKSRSGPAAEVLPAALADLAGRESGSFVILGNRKAQRYVQYLKIADALMLDFVLVGLTDEETKRSQKFFSGRGIEPQVEGRMKYTVYRMDFPPGSSQVDQATRVASEIFSEVFQVPEEALIEEFDPLQPMTKADAVRRVSPLPKVFFGIGLFFLAVSILLFGRYAHLMSNRIPVEGEVAEAWQTTCIVTSGETTSEQVCFAARVQFTSKDGRTYRTTPITRFFRPYQVGEKISLFYQPGHPEGAKPNYNDDFNVIALPAGFGAGGIFVGVIFLLADRKRHSGSGQAGPGRKGSS